MASQERERARQRLTSALIDRRRQSDCLDAAVGASTERVAYARLRAASDRVRTREAWLHWVDDEGHRGLNAGPFELLTERRENPPYY